MSGSSLTPEECDAEAMDSRKDGCFDQANRFANYADALRRYGTDAHLLFCGDTRD